MTPDQLPPLPEPETLGSSRFGSLYKGHTDAAMTAYGLQCAEAAVERERARIIAGVDKMYADCDDLRRQAIDVGKEWLVRGMSNRMMELALVKNLVSGK